jgi:hypothetical protein
MYDRPAEAAAASSEFGIFMSRFNELEQLAISDRYSFEQRATAFRKIFHGPQAPVKSTPLGVHGGGQWNIMIPGAAGTEMPPSWSDPKRAGPRAIAYLREFRVLTINGVQVTLWHLLAGADARNHPTDIHLLGVGRIRSNVEAVTFTGDLGSVVVHYIKAPSKRSFRDTAMELEPSLLASTYNADVGAPAHDMRGDADAWALQLDPKKTLGQNLTDYYAATGGSRTRWKSFGSAIGLGTFSSGRFPGNTEAWRFAMQGEIMSAALAYAAGQGYRGDIVNVLAKPQPGIFAPTFWEMYWNVSGWVLDEFLKRLTADAATEP